MKTTIIQQVNKSIPFPKLLKLLFILSVSLQLILISQFYFFQNEHSTDASYILAQLVRGSGLTLLGGIILAYCNLIFIRYLNSAFPWKRNIFKRFFIQFPFSILAGILITPLIVILAGLFITFEQDMRTVYINNAYYFAIVNLFLMIILEAWLYFIEGSNAKVKAENLERELSQTRFEVLKNQINPHFMFNSLNVLSGLIEKDVAKAQQFIDEFAQIYRYVLETIEKPVVSLNDELRFIRSYIFLQQIRYGQALNVTVNLPAELLSMLMPPLSLQLVLENAIKHNIINLSQPLNIEIYLLDDWLIVRNNIQPKISSNHSTGLGQKNLAKRYAMIGENIPEFMVETNYYLAKLPLINSR